jgi:hypothetical protein
MDPGTGAQAEAGVEESTHDTEYCAGATQTGDPSLFYYWQTTMGAHECHDAGGSQSPNQYRNITVQSITNPGVFSDFVGLNPKVQFGSTPQLGFVRGYAVNNGERHRDADSMYSQFKDENYVQDGTTVYVDWTTPLYFTNTTQTNKYYCIFEAGDSNFVTQGTQDTCP